MRRLDLRFLKLLTERDRGALTTLLILCAGGLVIGIMPFYAENPGPAFKFLGKLLQFGSVAAICVIAYLLPRYTPSPADLLEQAAADAAHDDHTMCDHATHEHSPAEKITFGELTWTATLRYLITVAAGAGTLAWAVLLAYRHWFPEGRSLTEGDIVDGLFFLVIGALVMYITIQDANSLRTVRNRDIDAEFKRFLKRINDSVGDDTPEE